MGDLFLSNEQFEKLQKLYKFAKKNKKYLSKEDSYNLKQLHDLEKGSKKSKEKKQSGIEKIISEENHKKRLKDPTLHINGSTQSFSNEFLESLETSQVHHHPSYYEKQKQKSKEIPYKKSLEYRHSQILNIIEDPTLIGLPKYAKPIRTAFLQAETNQNKIHLLMTADDKYYPINFKTKDSKSGKRTTKKRLIEIKETMTFDYHFKHVIPLYVHGEKLKTDTLSKDKFTPFNYTQ